MEHLIWILREGRIPCLFHELTGFYCPGCGGTRAVLALLAGHPVLSFLYHPLVPYCALVALVFAVSYAIYWKTKDPRFRLYLSDAYVHVGLGIIVVNFLVKNYLLAAKGIDILEQLPGWKAAGARQDVWSLSGPTPSAETGPAAAAAVPAVP